jgi:hypothetical protein
MVVRRAHRQPRCSSREASARARTDAHRFYTRLGFVDSHVGFKLSLT